MSSDPEEKPFSKSHLQSAEYREKLMRKLNCLIAVLEVACAKVRRSLAGEEPDVDRLMRIHKNLRETLDVCKRAKVALERREELAEGMPENLDRVMRAGGAGRVRPRPENRAAQVELSSDDEREKFSKLGPIDPEELNTVDFDQLARELLG